MHLKIWLRLILEFGRRQRRAGTFTSTGHSRLAIRRDLLLAFDAKIVLAVVPEEDSIQPVYSLDHFRDEGQIFTALTVHDNLHHFRPDTEVCDSSVLAHLCQNTIGHGYGLPIG